MHRGKWFLHDDPRVDRQSFLAPAEVERAGEDVAAGLRGEDGQPVDDRGGDEVGTLRLADGVAAAHGRRVAERKRSFKSGAAFPKRFANLGNEEQWI